MVIQRSYVFFVFVFFISTVFVSSYSGVSPSSYDIDFESNYKESFPFNFFLSSDVKSDIFVEGDLAEYVSLNKNNLKGSGQVIASLNLPSKINPPGIHYIYVRAKEIIEVEDGIGISLSVGGVLKVRVPYPGKYAELDLSVENVNQGEPINLSLEVFSRGDQDIFAEVDIEVRDSNKNLKDKKNIGSEKIESTKSKVFTTSLNTKDYLSGDYNISAIVNYGGEFPASVVKEIRLGELKVLVSNNSEFLERKKINRFIIEVESYWNGEIEGVFADVRVLQTNESFKTPSTILSPWQKTTLNGFLDTSSIEGDYFDAEITVHYADKTSSKLVRVNLIKEHNYVMIIVIVLSILVLIMLVIIVVKYIKKNFKVVRNESLK